MLFRRERNKDVVRSMFSVSVSYSFFLFSLFFSLALSHSHSHSLYFTFPRLSHSCLWYCKGRKELFGRGDPTRPWKVTRKGEGETDREAGGRSRILNGPCFGFLSKQVGATRVKMKQRCPERRGSNVGYATTELDMM